MDEGSGVTVILALDGIFFVEAKKEAAKAAGDDKEFAKWQDYVRRTNESIDQILADDSRNDEEAHDLCVELDRHWQSFGHAAARLAQSVAATHILCGTSLEAHINMRAGETLKGKEFAEFDKLTLSGKWLFYPTLISTGHFDASND